MGSQLLLTALAMLPVDWEFPNRLGSDAHLFDATNRRHFPHFASPQRTLLRSCLCMRCGTPIATHGVINATTLRAPLRPACRMAATAWQHDQRTKPTTGYRTTMRLSKTPFQGGNVMLVLSRKRGETIHIGDRITITVVRTHGNRITIGIDAPEELRILRGELDQWSDPPVTKAASAATLFHG
jgi:carbon storage regulator